MTRYWGVKCRTCGSHIPFEKCLPDQGKAVTIRFVPLDPIRCPKCENSHLYDPAEGMYFYEQDGLLIS
jgi:hypothetical protein